MCLPLIYFDVYSDFYAFTLCLHFNENQNEDIVNILIKLEINSCFFWCCIKLLKSLLYKYEFSYASIKAST